MATVAKTKNDNPKSESPTKKSRKAISSKVESERHNIEQVKVDLNTVYADPELNARTDGYTEDELTDLAGSILQVGGLIQPLVICEAPEELKSQYKYVLVAGFRRYYALQKLAKDEEDQSWIKGVPASVENRNNVARLAAVQLVENIQRLDMNPLDIAQSIENAIQVYDINQTEFARMLGYTDKDKQAWISQYRKLLKLPEDVQTLLQEGEVTFSAARELLRLPKELQSSTALLATKLTFAKFKVEVDKLLGVKGDGTGTAGTTDGTGTDDSTQRIQKSVKSKKLEQEYLPMLKKALEAAKSPTDKKDIQTRVDTVNWVLSGAEDTGMAKLLKPFIDEQEKLKAEEEKNKEVISARKEYIAGLIRRIKFLLNPKNYGQESELGRTIPTPAEALAKVKSEIETDIKGKKLPFEIKDVNEFMIEVGTEYDNHLKHMHDMAEGRRKKKEEDDRKAKEEEANASQSAKAESDSETSLGEDEEEEEEEEDQE